MKEYHSPLAEILLYEEEKHFMQASLDDSWVTADNGGDLTF